ncbi:MAG: hypothetical protein HY824_03295 [Acidobacteria bacterium]|nr:hypothetical protein [Acidobacteriota bacterium]
MALALLVTTPILAQDWTDYINVQDGFRVDFPGQPKVAETTWMSEYGYTLPGRVYTVEKGRERYSVTVIDYRPIEQQGVERRKKCPAGAEPCIGSDIGGEGHWKHDTRGAIVYAVSKFFERNAKVTRYLWGHQDLVEGHLLQMTNPDKSRTYAFVSMHEMKLYVLEGTVPDGYPEPGLFQQSMGWVDRDGNGIRYQTIYSNQYYGLKQMPPPPRAGGGRGRGAGPQGRGAGNAQ